MSSTFLILLMWKWLSNFIYLAIWHHATLQFWAGVFRNRVLSPYSSHIQYELGNLQIVMHLIFQWPIIPSKYFRFDKFILVLRQDIGECATGCLGTNLCQVPNMMILNPTIIPVLSQAPHLVRTPTYPELKCHFSSVEISEPLCIILCNF